MGVSPTTRAPAPHRIRSDRRLPPRRWRSDAQLKRSALSWPTASTSAKPRPDRAFSIVFVRLWVTEVRQHSVTHVFRHESRRTARPFRLRSGDTRRSVRASLLDRAERRAPSSPTRSQNITVNCRRSPTEAGTEFRSLRPRLAVGRSGRPSLAPHSEQNFEFGGFEEPQDGHRSGGRRPH